MPPYRSSFVSSGLGTFSHKPSLVANEYLYHTREQALYPEKNRCGGRSLRTILIGFAQASMEANGCFTTRHGPQIAQLHT
jgi:hypothetical protein